MGTQTAATQSDSLFGLLSTVGTAYFGAQAAQATAAKTTAINSTGTTTATAAGTAAQWIPGIGNGAIVLGVGALVAIGLASIFLRR
jgi:hypothetical protein